MRPTALIHLLLAGQRNADRGYPGAALFELGPIFRGTEPDQQSLSLAGMRRVETVRDWAGETDITALSAKEDAIAALAAMGLKRQIFKSWRRLVAIGILDAQPLSDWVRKMCWLVLVSSTPVSSKPWA